MPTPRSANHGGTGGQAISVGGNLEPIEPVYTDVNRQSGLGTPYPIPSKPVGWKAPVVLRGQDTRGMRYLYADQRIRQPISPLGTGPDIGVAVWSSEFQPNQGSLRDYGFYDLLYRAGYPGFNLGLSFKVPVNPSVGSQGPGFNMHMKSPNRQVIVNVFRRVSAQPSYKG
jgi:hypothetical protein